MELDADRQRGNGCLYAIGGLGVLAVIAGIGLEKIGDLDLDFGSDAPPTRGFVVDDGVPAEPAPTPPIAPAAPPAPMSPSPPPEPVAHETARVLWHAEVVEGPLAAGTPCVIGVDVERTLAGPRPTHVRVDCDGQLRYEAAASGTIEETPESAGAYAYRAAIDSAITGASLDLRSGVHRATLRETAGVTSFYVEDLSVPRRGDPFYQANAGRVAEVTERLRLLAVPNDVTGDAPPSVVAASRSGRPQLGAPAASCELTGATVPSSRFPCRLTVRCGTTIVYGAGTTGYNDCAVTDGAIATAEDTGTTLENDDPRIVLDAQRRTLVISDDDGVAAWSASFALSEDPRCTVAGSWAGHGVDDEGARFRWTMDGVGGSAPWTGRIRWSNDAYDGLEETVEVTPECSSGRWVMTTRALADPTDTRRGSATYTVWLGPSFGALAGGWTAEDGAPGALWGARR